MKPLTTLVAIILASPAYALTFTATNTPYQALETSHFIVRYELGDRQAAQDVAKALEANYNKITKDLGIKPKEKTIIELYTTPGLYQRYKKPAEWAIGGKVYPEWNMMALPSPSTWGKANVHRYEDLWHVLPHEYTHLLLRRYTLPMWLDEGVAVYESGQWNPGYKRILKEAIKKDELLSLKELEDFNAFIKGGALSYAESHTAIHYIKTVYGEEAIKRIIDGLAQGMSFEQALKTTTGIDRDEFEKGWLFYLEGLLRSEKHAKNTLQSMKATGTELRTKAPVATPWDEVPRNDDTEDDGAIDYPIGEMLPPPTLLGASFAMMTSIIVFLRILKETTKNIKKTT
jgi:hypothetical protein